jgi:formate hydrogenlyase subunit 4
MEISSIGISLLQTFLFMGISPGVIGLLRWMKARLQGRHGPSLLQPYFDLQKLLFRQVKSSENSSWIFKATPGIIFGCLIFIGFLTPIVYLPLNGPITVNTSGPIFADFLSIIYLLALTRFLIALAGMDTGSPFGGMGSGREMLMNFISEPVLVMSLFALVLNSHTTSLPGIMANQYNPDFIEGLKSLFEDPSLWFIFLALLVILLAETGRIPFDNPSTHLELTMIGKAIQLEYGGMQLALLEWAEAMRLTFFIILVLNIFVPFTLAAAGRPAWQNILLLAGFFPKLAVMIFFLALWELTRAKMRLKAVFVPAGLALAFSILAVFIALVINYLEFNTG